MTQTLSQPPGAPAAADLGPLELAGPPGLPRMIRAGGVLAPEAPKTPEGTGLDGWVLSDLALKLITTVPHVTNDWVAEQMRLAPALVEKILWQLKEDQFVEILGQVDELNYRYAATARGREYAKGLFEISGYVGPTPVSLEAYAAMLDWQTAQRRPPMFERIRDLVTSQLVISPQAVEVAALAASSARSLFVFGPAGNGKTSLGRLLHQVVEGDVWVPYCISVGGTVIRIYDKQLHQLADAAGSGASSNGGAFGRGSPIDRRWVRIRPPFIVAGGEMTIAELDLAYSTAHRFYEAPPHVKANGGTFLIDDFGRQRIEPAELLNRWIVPLEHRVDYLTLHTGQKIEIPFRLLLLVATNLPINEVSDPAFLRRMGYRLHLDKPTPELYADIFRRYAKGAGVSVPAGLLEGLLERYCREGRDLRASEPRDLIERARDLCKLRRRPFALDRDVMDSAWAAYFGLTQ